MRARARWKDTRRECADLRNPCKSPSHWGLFTGTNLESQTRFGKTFANGHPTHWNINKHARQTKLACVNLREAIPNTTSTIQQMSIAKPNSHEMHAHLNNQLNLPFSPKLNRSLFQMRLMQRQTRSAIRNHMLYANQTQASHMNYVLNADANLEKTMWRCELFWGAKTGGGSFGLWTIGTITQPAACGHIDTLFLCAVHGVWCVHANQFGNVTTFEWRCNKNHAMQWDLVGVQIDQFHHYGLRLQPGMTGAKAHDKPRKKAQTTTARPHTTKLGHNWPSTTSHAIVAEWISKNEKPPQDVSPNRIWIIPLSLVIGEQTLKTSINHQ